MKGILVVRQFFKYKHRWSFHSKQLFQTDTMSIVVKMMNVTVAKTRATKLQTKWNCAFQRPLEKGGQCLSWNLDLSATGTSLLENLHEQAIPLPGGQSISSLPGPPAPPL